MEDNFRNSLVLVKPRSATALVQIPLNHYGDNKAILEIVWFGTHITSAGQIY
jgi:hypothetical protein